MTYAEEGCSEFISGEGRGEGSPGRGESCRGSEEGEDGRRMEGVQVALKEVAEQEEKEAEILWGVAVVVRHAG